jgi:DNA mismatch repair ATPase MutL
VKDVIAEAIRGALASAGITGDAPNELIFAPRRPAVEDLRPPTNETPASGNVFTFEDRSTPVEPVRRQDLIDLAAGAAARAAKVGDTPEPATTSAEVLGEPFEELKWESPAAEFPGSESADLPPVNSAAKLAKTVEPNAVASTKIRPLGQMHDSFIVAVDDEGLLLVDQHVAHERILFDKYSRSEAGRTIESQNLLLPETLDLSPAQSEAFALIENELEQLGFGVMKLSGRTVAIKSIPTDLPASEARNLFAEILDTVDAEKSGRAKLSLRDDIAASLACKAAVKINMKLTPEKMQWLIDRLLLTSSPTTCPHGRPVILRLSMKDIERGFHRT